jgi:hypothetical protein
MVRRQPRLLPRSLLSPSLCRSLLSTRATPSTAPRLLGPVLRLSGWRQQWRSPRRIHGEGARPSPSTRRRESVTATLGGQMWVGAASGSLAAYARRSTGAVRGKSRRLRTEEHRGRSVGGCSAAPMAPCSSLSSSRSLRTGVDKAGVLDGLLVNYLLLQGLKSKVATTTYGLPVALQFYLYRYQSS